jgi:RNA polymerase sigma factor (sigma-70 family)
MQPAQRSESAALVKAEDHTLAATTEQEQRFVVLHELLFPRLCDFAAFFLRPDDALDAVHEAMCDIWLRWRDLAPKQPGVPFFVRAVRNQIVLTQRRERFDRLRLRRFFHYVTRQSPSWPAPDAELESAELAAIIDATVASMPPRCREVWTLVRANEMTYEEAADALELSVVTAKRHMTRARALLRGALIDAGYGEAAGALLKPVTKLLPTKAAEGDARE